MKIKEKKYYKMKFTLASPLAIGDGSNYTTDRDVVRDSKGVPYIPASAIAGVSRSMFLKNKNLIDLYFGKVDINTDRNNSSAVEAKESRLIFYDANIPEKADYNITVRDSVALDECKTAMDGAKFDMEVLEPGIEFTTYIEQNIYSDSDENIAYEIVCKWLHNKVHLGGKTMRGYGEVKDVSVLEKNFSLDEDEKVSEWLLFDMYDENAWKDAEEIDSETETYDDGIVKVILQLKQNSGISIRRYTTKISEDENVSLPDSEQLFVRINGNEIPVIPGTSWAGAFSHRMKELVPECVENNFFGNVSKNRRIRSKIMFGETQLFNAIPKVMTRNAIDRFSGGTANQALFTEQTYYDGEGELKIEIKKDEDSQTKKYRLNKEVAKALAATITDLHNGFLAVGGLTAIGRGLFKVTGVQIDGKNIDFEQNTMYASLVKALGGVD